MKRVPNVKKKKEKKRINFLSLRKVDFLNFLKRQEYSV